MNNFSLGKAPFGIASFFYLFVEICLLCGLKMIKFWQFIGKLAAYLQQIVLIYST
uniref:Uncharacterized protein n=1 Tax=Rhizophora mucronata TaxID=61149 RepID=A0A2P2PJM6_RHIMU